uniref:Retrovirus-related Pol polyprotein from transposon TNT 1-94-like beta-barrel domain-containing protein n=1 Tax=Lactuca sativa TaxID=4236 RepID=A0A9R1WY28_LACSA|nr:hypothetical protein LSAT_V11C800416860 [Lactuca sativa]
MVEGESSKNQKKSNGKRKFKGKDEKSSNMKAKYFVGIVTNRVTSRKIVVFAKLTRMVLYQVDPRIQKSNKNYISVISEAFYVQDDKVAWCVDSGATSHPIEDRYVVKMGNVATEPIKGIGSVLLTFTFGKCLCLNNVLYVLEIRKNLVFEIVLNNCGYKQVLESDKYISSRHGSFMGFGYICNGMIRLNINYPSSDNSVCMASSSTSNNFHKFELWHARLGHIHY